MEQSPETRSLRDYLRAIRARRWLVIGTTLAALAVSVLYSLVKTPEYEATASISVRPNFNVSQSGGQTPPQGAAAKQAALVVTTPDVLAAASNALGDRTAQQLESSITTTADSSVNSVSIKATADTAGGAARTANAVAAAVVQVTFNDYLESLRTSLGSQLTPAQARGLPDRLRASQPIRIASSAVAPGSPTSPKPLRDAAFAALLGLLLGVGIALVRDALDRTVTDPQDLESSMGLPLLGYVRSDGLGTAPVARNGTLGGAQNLDSFRILRANAQFLAGDRPVATLAVTSPLPEEGKSTVAAWYAYASALAGKRTILIECDLHKPVLAERFGLDPSPGLADHLTGGADSTQVLRPVSVEGPTARPLSIVPAGEQVDESAELFAAPRFGQFLGEVSREYELVVLDCPPLLPVGDTLSIVPRVEGVILCIRLGQTNRDQAVAARDALRRLPERPVGLVLTASKPGSDYDYSGRQPSGRDKAEATA